MTETGLRPGLGLVPVPLLEREHELSVFGEFLTAGTRTGVGPVLIAGPAGIGKTRLIAELREHATAGGMRVLVARGSELEREFPFGVVRQLFEAVLSEPGVRDRVLVDAAAAAGAVFECGAPADADPDADVSFAVLHGLYWLTVNLAGQGPLLLAVDDVNWCDRPSLRFLAYLARRAEGLDVVLAVRQVSAKA
jgi:predicted ATPase